MDSIGQYYRFANIDKKQICEQNRGLMKLTEHSYLGNEYCDDILNLLNNEWKNDRVIHVGDYAEPNDETTTDNFIKGVISENKLDCSVYDWASNFDDVSPSNDKIIRYIYNHDKKEYIDLLKQPIQWCCVDKNKINFAKFNSFALLIGCGNGLGGGDYCSINDNHIGDWAGDRFESSEEFLEKYSNYSENKLIFNEFLKIEECYIDDDYNDSKDSIYNGETKMLNEYLEHLNKDKVDISKLKIKNNKLTLDERRIFKKVLEDYQKKNCNRSNDDVCL